MSFELAIKHILKMEGGKADSPTDKGGRTAYGITQATYTRWRQSQGLKPASKDVWEITKDEYMAIYRQIWTESRADLIDAYAPLTALVHFDMAVNAGFQRRGTDAAEILQITARGAIDNLVVDGYVGPKTLDAVAKGVHMVGDKTFALGYLDRRENYYNKLAAADPKFGAPNLKGWLKRVNYYVKIVEAT